MANREKPIRMCARIPETLEEVCFAIKEELIFYLDSRTKSTVSVTCPSSTFSVISASARAWRGE